MQGISPYVEIVALEKTFKQQDRLTQPGIAQLHRCIKLKQGETVSDILQRLGRTHQTMPVGISLDYSPRFRRISLTGSTLLGDQIVVAQRS